MSAKLFESNKKPAKVEAMSKFTKSIWINLAIVIAIIGVLVSIMIPSYCDYMPRAKWAKAIASISALKLAVSDCLLDNKANPQTCSSVTKLNKYGLKAMPVLAGNAGKVEILPVANRYPLTIIITGYKDLEGCRFAFVPASAPESIISWNVVFIDSTGASEKTCLTRIKGAKSLAQFSIN